MSLKRLEDESGKDRELSLAAFGITACQSAVALFVANRLLRIGWF